MKYSNMKCPRCSIHLKPRTKNPCIAFSCTMCEGIFIDSTKLDRTKNKSLFYKIFEIKNNAPNKLNLKCLNCNIPFVQFIYPYQTNNLVLDYCPSCEWLWLDHEEKPIINFKKNESEIDESELFKKLSKIGKTNTEEVLFTFASQNIYKIQFISFILIIISFIVFFNYYPKNIESFKELIRWKIGYKRGRLIYYLAFFYHTSVLNLIFGSLLLSLSTLVLRKTLKSAEYISLIFVSQIFGYLFISRGVEVNSISGNLPAISSLIAFYSYYFSLDKFCIFLKKKLQRIPKSITFFITPKFYIIVWSFFIYYLSLVTHQKEINFLSVGGIAIGFYFGYLKFNSILDKDWQLN